MNDKLASHRESAERVSSTRKEDYTARVKIIQKEREREKERTNTEVKKNRNGKVRE